MERGFQRAGGNLHDRRVHVFGSAAHAGHAMEQKKISFVRGAAEEFDLLAHHGGEVADQTIGVKSDVAPDDHFVRKIVHFKGKRLVRTDFEGAVDERVVIGRVEFPGVGAAIDGGQTGGNAPSAGYVENDSDGRGPKLLNVEKHRFAGQKRVGVIDVAGAIVERIRMQFAGDDHFVEVF